MCKTDIVLLFISYNLNCLGLKKTGVEFTLSHNMHWLPTFRSVWYYTQFCFCGCFSLWCNGMISGLTTLYKYPEQNGEPQATIRFTSTVLYCMSQKIFPFEKNVLLFTINNKMYINITEAADFYNTFVSVQLRHGECILATMKQIPLWITQWQQSVSGTKMLSLWITIVVAHIWIFNGYLFVMDIKLLMVHAIHFRAVAHHTVVSMLHIHCSGAVAGRTWSSNFSLLA